MISEPTTIILGAGVSKPYGFPIGLDLRNEIIDHTLVRKDWSFWNALSIDENLVIEFVTRFRDSNIYSIDKFLENNPNYLQVGKICIAVCIREKEDHKNFFRTNAKSDGIYQYLFNELVSGIRWNEVEQNKLSFITFNYDRSLEQYLFESYCNFCPRNTIEETLSSFFQYIPIYHVHGKVGDLDWQGKKGTQYKPLEINHFKGRITEIEKIKMASENIVLVSEQDPQTANKLAYILKSSKNIIFLGFGYHNENLNKLKIDSFRHLDNEMENEANDLSKVTTFRGNAYGLGKSQMKKNQNRWKIYLPTNEKKDIEFLKDYVQLD
ncbi:MAG: hypothetical protein PWQ55_329 [Chloroflexota bacterium]|nr:hypothetical protein [Chloroflexota bacterium]